MKHHGIKKGRLDSVSSSSLQVHGQTSLTASHDITSFVGQRRDVMRWPPALWGGCGGNSGIEIFGTGGDTHTVPLCGARVKNLHSHLKSLRNKRKERQKEQR